MPESESQFIGQECLKTLIHIFNDAKNVRNLDTETITHCSKHTPNYLDKDFI